jgi:hypothetical protein
MKDDQMTPKRCRTGAVTDERAAIGRNAGDESSFCQRRNASGYPFALK